MQFCSVYNCKYPNFSIDKVTKLPYCRNHQTRRTDFDRRTIIQRAMQKGKALSTKVRTLGVEVAKKEKVVDTMLELWYLSKKHQMTGHCEECGAWTNKTHDKYYRWSCCHVVPKALIPDVATHPNNFIELCQIHHQEYDAGFERAKRMKCFRIAKLQFDTFKHLIPETKLKWINPYLLQSESTNPTCAIDNN